MSAYELEIAMDESPLQRLPRRFQDLNEASSVILNLFTLYEETAKESVTIKLVRVP